MMMNEIDILDADSTTIAIKKLILEAKEYVVLICPYLDLSATIVASIQKARERKVAIHVVYRVDTPADETKSAQLEKQLISLGCSVSHCRRLHTKCYMNEQFVIISSLNLLTSSQSGNFELSTRFDIATHPTAYSKVLSHLKDIYMVSGSKFPLEKKPIKDLTQNPSEVVTRDRSRKRWTTAEEKKLERLFLENIEYERLAQLMGRTVSSITSRLVDLGYLKYDRESKDYIRIK